jgi:hypothetical protein
MDRKKGFNVYYLLVSEGTVEFNIFAYLTKNKFRTLFEKSNIKFSNKVEIIKGGNQIVFQGKLGGTGNIGAFKAKYELIRDKYVDQKRFFILDKDLDDTSLIEKLIKDNGDIIQFVEYNSEYLLLKFSGKSPKKPTEFKNMNEFRSYCKTEFKKQFNKIAPEFKEVDLDPIFNNVSEEEIRASFKELFLTLSQ